tara:strand:+ start:1772 stop:2512 length:741 start_codon:yes stop_codon:yes gene_type:complete
MPKKDKLGILDLETLDDTWTKSAEVGMLQWVLKLINAEHQKKLTSGLTNLDKKESEKENEELYEQYQSFGSALKLNEDDDYTPDDVEQVMRHFISAHDKSFNAKGIKSLDRGKYEIDDEVAYYIKESFLRYLDSTQKKGELDKAFKSVKTGGVKKPFPSARQGYVPDDIKEMTDIIMNPPYPTLNSALEIVSGGDKAKISNLKRYWKEYKRNSIITFEIGLGTKDLDFSDEMVEQIRKYYIKDFRK